MIAINASILGERPSGLGQYALNVIRGLDALREGLIVHTSFPEPLADVRAIVYSRRENERGVGGRQMAEQVRPRPEARV